MPTISVNGSSLEITCEPGQVSDGYHTFDELYEHRCLLFCLILKMIKLREDYPLAPHGNAEIDSWKSRKHHDGSTIDEWFIAGLTLETSKFDRVPNRKTITYHLPDRMWELVECEELETAPQWDGHTSQEVLDRLRWFLKDAR